jgi:hypothetical protein
MRSQRAVLHAHLASRLLCTLHCVVALAMMFVTSYFNAMVYACSRWGTWRGYFQRGFPHLPYVFDFLITGLGPVLAIWFFWGLLLSFLYQRKWRLFSLASTLCIMAPFFLMCSFVSCALESADHFFFNSYELRSWFPFLRVYRIPVFVLGASTYTYLLLGPFRSGARHESSTEADIDTRG